MATAGNPHVYFTRLELTNVRSFADGQNLDLTDGNGRPARWTLILGENGVGKTTLLQCLAMMRPTLTVPRDAETNAPKPDQVAAALFILENDQIAALARMGETEVSLRAELSTGRALGEGGNRGRVKTETTFTVDASRGLDTLKSPSESHPSFVEPLVIGYGAARHIRYRSLEAFDADTDSTASLFDPSLELADAKAILEQLDYAASKQQPHAEALLEAVKQALVTLLPDLKDASDIHLYGPAAPRSKTQMTGVRVQTPYGEVPLAELSLGYQTMTAWAVDLAWRLYRHYPDADEPLKQPAIVLIDELDLHLHPRWQRQLRNHISAAFPAVQFIATAHSPLLAQCYLDTNLAVVREESGQATIVNDPSVVKTWRLDELVTSALYEVGSPYSVEVEDELTRRTVLLQKARLTPVERAELADLQRMVGSLSTVPTQEDREAADIIRQAARMLKTPDA